MLHSCSRFHARSILACSIATLLAGLGTNAALAQTAPDAGRVLQDLTRPVEPLKPSTRIDLQGAPLSEAAPGGAQVELNEVSFVGASRFDEAELQAVVADALGQAHDLAGLKGLANRISLFYRERGYPFARAFLPAQRMGEGKLLIEIVEGRYGQVTAVSPDPKLAAGAQPFLDNLEPGEVISSDELERATLILGDQPGVSVVPVMRPGEAMGTGDLDVQVRRDPLVSGKVGLDNHGNRYTGRYRSQAEIKLGSPFLFGDELSFNGLLSDEELWLGRVGYSLPLGASGLRGEISYAHTRYELGTSDFEELDNSGHAKVRSLGLSYPLVRSQTSNVLLSAHYQHKDLRDEYGAANVTEDKTSETLPVTLQFDHRDGFAGGGITYGALVWTPGRLSLDSPEQKLVDELTDQTAGHFHKLNLDLARLQRLGGSLTLFARIASQWSESNLDSSEGFSLGGAYGVRAYPQGEAFGDEGWLGQLELRYSMGRFEPYVFFDSGEIKTSHSPIDSATEDNTRSISGAGSGVRFYHGDFSIDTAVAWAHTGGQPQSDTRDEEPRLWFNTQYRF